MNIKMFKKLLDHDFNVRNLKTRMKVFIILIIDAIYEVLTIAGALHAFSRLVLRTSCEVHMVVASLKRPSRSESYIL